MLGPAGTRGGPRCSGIGLCCAMGSRAGRAEPGGRQRRGAQTLLWSPGGVIKDWPLPQGAGWALAVGNRAVPQSSMQGFRVPAKAIGQGFAIRGYKGPRRALPQLQVRWRLWPMPRGLMSTQLWQSGHNVICGEGWTQLEDGDTTGGPGAPAGRCVTLSLRRGRWVSGECPRLGSKDSLSTGAACVKAFSSCFSDACSVAGQAPEL